MWFTSKLCLPPRRDGTIVRPRLLRLLEQNKNKHLILCQSPAGFGKTTLIADWLSNKERVAWVSLDPQDNDIQLFQRYLDAAIDGCFQSTQTQSSAPLSTASDWTLFHQQLYTKLEPLETPLYLVLDDYHHIKNAAIHQFLRLLLQYPPQCLRLLLITRQEPSLGIANLRIRNRLFELNATSLAFNARECQQFFQRRLGHRLSPDDIDHILLKTEGWPSALQLIALHNRQLSNSPPQDFSLNHQHLWSYLTEEVFEQLPEAHQQLLMQCAVFDTFNTALIHHLTQDENAMATVEQLKRQGLFIYAIDQEGQWFRFHPLFHQFLTHQRQLKQANLESHLHRLASSAWQQQRQLKSAMNHALKSKDVIYLQELLTLSGWALFQRCEFDLLEQAFLQIHQIKAPLSAPLQLLWAWLLLCKDGEQASQRYLDAHESLTPHDRWLADRTTFMALLAIYRGEWENAETLMNQATSYQNHQFNVSQAMNLIIRALLLVITGKQNRARSLFQQAEKMAIQQRYYGDALFAMLYRLQLLMSENALEEATQLNSQIHQLVHKQQLQQWPIYVDLIATEQLLRIKQGLSYQPERLDHLLQANQERTVCLGQLLQLIHAASQQASEKTLALLSECELQLLSPLQQQFWQAEYDTQALLHIRNQPAAITQWLKQRSHQLKQANWMWSQCSLNHLLACVIQSKMQQEQIQCYQALRAEILTLQPTLSIEYPARLAMLELLIIQPEHSQAKELNTVLEQFTRSTPGELLQYRALLMPYIQQHHLSVTPPPLLQAYWPNDAEAAAPPFFRQPFTATVIQHLRQQPQFPHFLTIQPLTMREWEVLGFIYIGLSNEEIADHLGVAATTLKTHIRNLYQKIGVTRRKQAIDFTNQLTQLLTTDKNTAKLIN